jgi:protein O-GlcNAc transferase
MRVISFSLWGDNPNYTYGAIRCAEQAQDMYPDFICWFYIHEPSVPKNIINTLSTMKNVRIIFKSGDLATAKPMMWRFEAIDDPDVEIMMSRDTDTDFLLREQLAVKEWIDSRKTFHIMRDHPHHGYHIMGGMFATRKIAEIPIWKDEMDTIVQTGPRNYDQKFLRDFIYPRVVNDSVIHASFNPYEPHCQDFPIKYDHTYKFVGEYVYVDGTRSLKHTTDLMDALRS